MDKRWYVGNSNGKRPYEGTGGGRYHQPDLRQKLSREQEEQRRQQRGRDEDAECRREEDCRNEDRYGALPPRDRDSRRTQPQKKKNQDQRASRRNEAASEVAAHAPHGEGLEKEEGANNITCFNCGQLGHVQAECKGQPFCAKCKQGGHLSAMCTITRRSSDPAWVGFGRGQDFFLL